jgi:hypothetical protein
LPDPDAPYYTNDTAVQRTVPPSQYENGEWNKDGDCLRSRPSRRGEKRIQGIELYLHKLQMEEFERAAGAAAVRMLLMDTTEAMMSRADAHPSKFRGCTPEKYFTVYHDCVHWCLPGAIDTWNDMLLHMLTS